MERNGAAALDGADKDAGQGGDAPGIAPQPDIEAALGRCSMNVLIPDWESVQLWGRARYCGEVAVDEPDWTLPAQ
jgi:hypothetical protein